MTRKQTEVIEKLTSKINRILQYKKDHPDSNIVDNLLRLIIAEKIRAIAYIRPTSMVRAKNEDGRAIVAQKVSRGISMRMIKNLQIAQRFQEEMLLGIGGKHREGDKLSFSKWLKRRSFKRAFNRMNNMRKE